MKYDKIVEAKFVKRLNRFIGEVILEGKYIKVHIRNTGRCKELLTLGARVFLEPAKNKERKTRYSLVAVYKDDRLINMDSQIPNYVVKEGMLNNKYLVEMFGELSVLKSEVTYGSSRFDLYYENNSKGTKGFIEVKGVTLEIGGMVRFPDAPTTRGTKHLNELIEGQLEGYKNYIFFLVQMESVKYFEPNIETDPIFSNTLKKAKSAGIGILCFDSIVELNSILLGNPVEIHL